MASRVELIVGLGNPGAEYEATRHNVGFWFVDALARHQKQTFRDETKFFGEACKIAVNGETCWLLKPLTFMNRSGQAVQALASYYKIPVENILVVHDELDLPPGVVRFKQGGGHGGHNGLRSIIASLGKSNFARLRLGIGHPGHKDLVTPHVLRKATQQERAQIEECISDAVDVFSLMVKGDYQRVMNRLHTKGSRQN